MCPAGIQAARLRLCITLPPCGCVQVVGEMRFRPTCLYESWCSFLVLNTSALPNRKHCRTLFPASMRMHRKRSAASYNQMPVVGVSRAEWQILGPSRPSQSAAAQQNNDSDINTITITISNVSLYILRRIDLHVDQRGHLSMA